MNHLRNSNSCVPAKGILVQSGVVLAWILFALSPHPRPLEAAAQDPAPGVRQAPAHRLNTLQRGPSGSVRVFSGTERGLRLSRDNGATWETVQVNGTDHEVLSVAVHPRVGGTVWVGRRDGLWRTDDGGGRWEAQTPPRDGSIPLALALSPRDPRVLYLSAARQGVFRSVDGGRSWDAAGRGLPKHRTADAPEDIRTLLIDPTDPDVVYAAHPAHGVFKTTDGGARWEALNSGLAVARRWVGPPHLVSDPSGERVYLIVGQLVHSHLIQNRIYVLLAGRWFPLETELPPNDTILGATFDASARTVELWTESQILTVPAPARRQDR